MRNTVARIVGCVMGLLVAVSPVFGAEALRWRVGASWKDVSCESLKELREAGVECIEVGFGDLLKLGAEARIEKAREIVQNAQKAGIAIWSVHLPFGRGWDVSVVDAAKREEAMKKLLELRAVCEVLRPQKAIIHGSAEPIADAERSQRMAASRESLKRLTREFGKIGVQIALEDLPRTCLGNTPEEVMALIEGIEGIGVCLDTNHLLKGTPQDFVRKLGRRIVTLHVSDYDGVDERHWMAGEGIVDWKAVVGALVEVGYAGPFMYETRKHKDQQPIGVEEYRRFLEGVGGGR